MSAGGWGSWQCCDRRRGPAAVESIDTDHRASQDSVQGVDRRCGYEAVDEAGRLSGGSGLVGLGLIIGSLICSAGYWGSATTWSVAVPCGLAACEAIIIVGSLLSGHHPPAVIIAVFCSIAEPLSPPAGSSTSAVGEKSTCGGQGQRCVGQRRNHSPS